MDNAIKKRNHAIDIERGIAIICVIIGHMNTTPSVIKFLFLTFNMPFFFIISGKVFSTKKKSFKDFAVGKVKTLLVPYFILGFALYITTGLFNIITGTGDATFQNMISGIPHNIASLVVGFRLHDLYYTMWFVMALFFVQLIMFFVEKIAKDKWYIYLIVSIIFYIVGCLLVNFVKGFVFSLDLVPLGVGFFSLGVMAKCLRKDGINYSSKYFLPIAGLLTISTCIHSVLYSGGVGFYSAEVDNPVYSYLAAIIVSWLIVIICNNWGRSKFLENCGKNSLVIYAFNNNFAIPLGYFVALKLCDLSVKFNNDIMVWVITFGIALLTCLALSWIYNRCYKISKGDLYEKN